MLERTGSVDGWGITEAQKKRIRELGWEGEIPQTWLRAKFLIERLEAKNNSKGK